MPRPSKRVMPPAVAARIFAAPDSTLVDVLDHLLNTGVMLNGDVTLGVAGVDLIYLRLSSIVCAADRLLSPRTSASGRPRRRRARRSKT